MTKSKKKKKNHTMHTAQGLVYNSSPEYVTSKYYKVPSFNINRLSCDTEILSIQSSQK